MEINATLLGQMLTFAIFVWFTYRFIYPLLEQALEERKSKIADGLAAAEKGHETLRFSEQQSKEQIEQTKAHCAQMIEEANKEAQQILEAARAEALQEMQDLVKAGHYQIDQALRGARSGLQEEMTDLIILAAQKILGRTIKPEDHKRIINDAIQEIGKESK